MKKSRKIRTAFASSLLIAPILFSTSCGYNQADEKPTLVTEEMSDANRVNNNQNADSQFLVSVTELNLHEVDLAKLAQKKGKAAHIRELGMEMEKSHAQLQRDLASLAQRKSINLPVSSTLDAKNTYAKLNKMSGYEFDKAYATELVKSHKSAVSIFDVASTDSQDLEIKNWVIETLPELQKHLDHSVECQVKANKK